MSCRCRQCYYQDISGVREIQKHSNPVGSDTDGQNDFPRPSSIVPERSETFTHGAFPVQSKARTALGIYRECCERCVHEIVIQPLIWTKTKEVGSAQVEGQGPPLRSFGFSIQVSTDSEAMLITGIEPVCKLVELVPLQAPWLLTRSERYCCSRKLPPLQSLEPEVARAVKVTECELNLDHIAEVVVVVVVVVRL